MDPNRHGSQGQPKQERSLRSRQDPKLSTSPFFEDAGSSRGSSAVSPFSPANFRHAGTAAGQHFSTGRAGDAAVLQTYPEGVDDNINTLRNFRSAVAAVYCRKCKTPLASDLNVKGLCATWSDATNNPDSSPASVCAISCPKPNCKTLTCLGCGGKPVTGINKVKTGAGVLDWCCDDGRLFAVWLFSARYDQVELQMQAIAASKASSAASKASQSRLPSREQQFPPASATSPRYQVRSSSGAKQASTAEPKGTGYLGFEGYDDLVTMLNESSMYGPRATPAIDFQSADKLTDKVLSQLLTLITHLMPSKSGSKSYDKSPPAALKATLSLGLLLDKVAELLRNDSLTDIGTRYTLYFATFSFVERLGSHKAMVELVSRDRYYKSQSLGLQALSESGSQVPSDSKGKAKAGPLVPLVFGDLEDGKAPALVTRLQNLFKQSEIMLKGVQKAKRDFQDSSEQTTLELCRRVLSIQSSLSHALPNEKYLREKRQTVSNVVPADVKSKAWSAYHKGACVEFTEEVLQRHHFMLATRNLSQSPRGRIPYLMKELAGMATSLPEGIFVKASADTLGMLKCLIVGPEGTPYEGGLFEFDIFADNEYPIGPPHVHFCGTHGGRVDTNPNLHIDGTVCLSLLGTFSGPPESKWQSRKSTILSVLVSIQAMILNEEPWRNEPMATNDFSKQALYYSREYTKKVQLMTVRYAILPWLFDSSLSNSIWKDTVKKHFHANGDKVLQTVRMWSRNTPAIRSFRQQPRSQIQGSHNSAGSVVDLLKELERAVLKTR
ncbi:MAG: hypothetical protein M1837_004599 [Sclerophora amabilis]|nr:MAG: hypothetical protein M1837_004599 [Sclerophora amabilis]